MVAAAEAAEAAVAARARAAHGAAPPADGLAAGGASRKRPIELD